MAAGVGRGLRRIRLAGAPVKARERELAVVVAAALAMSLPFLGAAFHVDEPFFLDRAREFLSGAAFVPATWADRNNNPPMITWLLAAGTTLFGEREAALRAFLLPLDALAAASLYLLFARFLKKPLAWALVAVLGPAWALNMNRLMSEKPAMAFGLAALCALARACDESAEKKDAWVYTSGLFMALAVLSKYAAAAMIPAALWYLRARGTRPAEIAWWTALAVLPPALFLASRPELVSGAAATLAGASEGAWGAPAHRARSILAFLGGLSVLPLLGRFPRRTLGAALACAVLLFGPWLDAAPVRPLDRALGAWAAAAALAALATAAAARRAAGRALWLPWLAAAAAFAAAYWTVTSRVVLFAVPPLVLALAAASEAEGGARPPAPAAAALAAALSLCLGWVDFVYAGAQKDLAAELSAGGKPVRVAARLGLRHYLLRAGARPIDGEADWAALKAGEAAVFARTTTNFRPAAPRRANARTIRVGSAVPLRLISGFGGEAGFYSNVSGFLPFSVSNEPVEEFTVVEPL